jgi:hypothetical protein
MISHAASEKFMLENARKHKYCPRPLKFHISRLRDLKIPNTDVDFRIQMLRD